MAAAEYTKETTLFTTSETLNDIVARYPKALAVLHTFGLDTCCGGALPLHVAAKHHGLDLAILIAALRDALKADT